MYTVGHLHVFSCAHMCNVTGVLGRGEVSPTLLFLEAGYLSQAWNLLCKLGWPASELQHVSTSPVLECWHTSLHPTFFKSCFYFYYLLYGMCVGITRMYVCVACACSTREGQKRASDAPELQLQMTGSHHVGAGNQTQVFWKSTKCS